MGRSPNPTHATPAPEEVLIDVTLRAVLPMICPQSQGGCGRGMTPRVERWRKMAASGVQCADVQCTLCGEKFVYVPAVVRAKDNRVLTPPERELEMALDMLARAQRRVDAAQAAVRGTV